MFRKTLICVAGLASGISAGAYSSGYFNEDNAVTSLYEQALDRLDLTTPNASAASPNGIVETRNNATQAVNAIASPEQGGGKVAVATPPATVTATEVKSMADPLASDSMAAKMPMANQPSETTEREASVFEESPIENEDDQSELDKLAQEADAAAKAAERKQAALKQRKAEIKLKEAQLEMKQAQERKEQAERARIAEEKAEWDQAQTLVEDRFSKEVFKDSAGEKLNYRKLVPKSAKEDELYPLVLFLHGKGERGDDNKSQLKHGLRLLASDDGMQQYPAFVVAPQCPIDQYWAKTLEQKETTPKMDSQPTSAMRLVIELLDSMLLNDSVDPDRVYVTGLSMGGFGTFDLIARRPRLFAAAVPLCGGGDPSPSKLRRILNMPMWVVHGTEDKSVSVKRSREMVSALQAAGATPRYSELAGFGHNVWDAAYSDIELYKWMFSQSKAKTTNRTQSTVALKSAAANATGKPGAARNMKESKNATQAPKRKRSKTNPKSEALSGDWKVLAASQNGQQATKQALAGMSVKFDSDQFILKMGSRKEVAMFELPETKSVQQINILSGRQDMQESKGILKLKDDLLIICWGDPGSPRPTQFKNLMNVKSLVLERK